MPTISSIKYIQDAVFSGPFPSAFSEFGKYYGFSIAQKFIDEIFLELAPNEHIQRIPQSAKIERRPARFTFPSISFYLSEGNATAFWTR